MADIRDRLATVPLWWYPLVTGIPFGLVFGAFDHLKNPGYNAVAAGVFGAAVFGTVMTWFVAVSRRRAWPGLRHLAREDQIEVLSALRRGQAPTDPVLDDLVLGYIGRRISALDRVWKTMWVLPAIAVVQLLLLHGIASVGFVVFAGGGLLTTPTGAVLQRARLTRAERQIRARQDPTGDSTAESSPAEASEPVSTPPSAPADSAPGRLARIVYVTGIVVMTVGLVSYVVGDALHWPGRGPATTGELDGPYGAFPAPISLQSPVRPIRQVAAYPFPALIYQGLAVQTDTGSNTVTAYNIRTGRPYWRLTRHGHQIGNPALDAASGRVVVLWSSTGGLGQDTPPRDMMAIDLHTGAVRWDSAVTANVLDRLVVTRTAVVAWTYKTVTAFDPGTGRRLWTIQNTCDWARIVPTQATLVVEHECPGEERVDGIDLATGATRWTQTFARWWPDIPTAKVQGVRVGGLGPDTIAIWTIHSEGVFNATTGTELSEHPQATWDEKIFADGTGYGQCAHEEHAICAVDPSSGRILWTSPIPRSAEVISGNALTVVSGRLYTLINSPGDQGLDSIQVNDARTGAKLDQFPAPPALFHYADYIDIDPVTDGMFVLRPRIFLAPDQKPTGPRTAILADQP